jgi:putative transposase
VRFTLSYRDV